MAQGSDSKPRVMILGGRGYLAGHFRSIYPAALTPEVDITDPHAVARALDRSRPEVVVNCAGKTGRPNVDWCEAHRSETFQANVTGALVVLHACLDRGIYLVHLSSGCLYQGDNGGGGFGEDDAPNFAGSFYSRTKAWAEQAIRPFPVLTLRLRMPFDDSLSERNLICKLSRYRRVLTAANSITYLPDFLRAAEALIGRGATGVYNVVNEGAMSPYQVMCRFRDLVSPGHRFEPLAPEGLAEVTQAGRSTCVLSTSKLRAAGLGLPPVGQSLEAALTALARRQARRAA